MSLFTSYSSPFSLNLALLILVSSLAVKFKAALSRVPLVAAVIPSKLRLLKFLMLPAVFWVEAL